MVGSVRIGSAFSGIGCLELGVQMAIPDAKVLWQIEIEEWPRRVLAKHWPNADRSITDIKQAGAHNLEPVDLLVAGWPCTDISTAGSKEGLNGKQSGLFRELARLITEMVPDWIILENVDAVRSVPRGEPAIGEVLKTLADIGYDAIWDRCSAEQVGANHRRNRFFLIAWKVRTQEDVANSQRSGSQRSWASGSSLHSETYQDRQTSLTVTVDARQWQVEPSIRRVVNRSASRLHESHRRQALKALGNSVVPQCVYLVSRRLLELATDMLVPCEDCGNRWCTMHHVHWVDCACPAWSEDDHANL